MISWRSNFWEARPHLLLVFFAALQIADVLTTNRALALPGRAEINPVMVEAMSQLGSAWWLPKVAIVALVALAGLLASRRRSRILMSACYASITITFAVVASNIAHL